MGRSPKRSATREKYLAIQARYHQLYREERLRHDDVLKILCKEFFISSTHTLYNILAADISSSDDEEKE